VSTETAYREGIQSASCYTSFQKIKKNRRGNIKLTPPIFFPENVTAITMEFTWMIHTSFAIIRLFFHKISIIFNPLFANVR
jgi:hypothetical protein